jgi:raffinose/stachyose/melibiose transport system permease protein
LDKVLRDKKAILVFVVPTLLMYLLVIFFPMCQSIYFTFFEGTPNVNMEWRGFTNYLKLFSDPEFFTSLVITVQYLVVVACGWVILGLLSALLLAYGLKKAQIDIARTVIYMPVVIPSVAVAGMFAKIFALSPNYGLINSLLDLMGLDRFIQAWSGQSSTALMTVCAADLWRGFGYYTILFYAGWLNVPRELEEAARIDGCGTISTIRHIVMPTMKPVTIMCVVLAVMHALRVYDMPAVLTGGGPGRATETLSIYMYKVAFSNWKYGYGSTLAIVMLVMSLGLTQLISLMDRER